MATMTAPKTTATPARRGARGELTGMPDDRSQRLDSALVAWIGAPPPRDIGAGLPAGTRLHVGYTARADLIVVRAEAGPEVLRQLPASAAPAPILATTDHDPSTAERMAWIKAGAEDLVSFSALPIAVGRRLKRLQRERGQGEDPSGPSRAPVRSLPPTAQPRPRVEPPSAPLPPHDTPQRTGSRPPRLRSEAPGRARDEFPALRVPEQSSGVPPTVRPWIDALVAYVEERDALAGSWREGRLERLLEMLNHRERLALRSPRGGAALSPAAVQTTFGPAPEPGQPGLGWPALVRRGPGGGRKGIEVDEGRIIAVGTDGLCLSLPFSAGARQKLVLDIAADRATNAQLLVQARWQRRDGPERWLLGVIVLEIRLRALDDHSH